MKYLLTILLGLIGFSLCANSDGENNNRNIPLSGVDKLDIAISSGDIKIVSEDRDDFSIDLKTFNNGPKLIIETGNTLRIEVKKEGFLFFNFPHNRVKLTIITPKSFNGDMKIISSSGDVDISKLSLGNLEVKASSGDINGKSIRTYGFDVSDSSGDIELNDVVAKNLSVSISSGNLNLEGFDGKLNGKLSSGNAKLVMNELTEDIDLKLSSGDVKIDINGDLNAKLDLYSSSGDIEVDFPVLVNEKQKKNRFSGTAGNGKYNLNINSSSGDISIY